MSFSHDPQTKSSRLLILAMLLPNVLHHAVVNFPSFSTAVFILGNSTFCFANASGEGNSEENTKTKASVEQSGSGDLVEQIETTLPDEEDNCCENDLDVLVESDCSENLDAGGDDVKNEKCRIANARSSERKAKDIEESSSDCDSAKKKQGYGNNQPCGNQEGQKPKTPSSPLEETEPSKLIQQTHEARNTKIIDRFSKAVAGEIKRRFPSIQFPPQFQLQLPQFHFPFLQQRQGRKNQKSLPSIEGVRSTANHPYKPKELAPSSMVDMSTARRVGAWCPPLSKKENVENPDDGDVELDEDEVIQMDESPSTSFEIDKSISVCPPDSAKSVETLPPEHCQSMDNSYEDFNGGENGGIDYNDDIDQELQPGTVLFVLPASRELQQNQHTPGVLGNSNEEEIIIPIEENVQIITTGSRCLSEMEEHFGDDDEIIQYALLQREHRELGNIDIHKRDFAYHPVALNSGNGFEDRAAPDEEALESYGSQNSYYLPGTSHEKHHQSTWDGEDQQVSFRWWSWVSHFSQIFHSSSEEDVGDNLDSDGSTTDDAEHHSQNHNEHQHSYQRYIYEEAGKHAFAGGSHGEIWRARRRCPMRRAKNESQPMEDEIGDNSSAPKTSTSPDSSSKNSSTSSCNDEKDLIVKRLKIEHGYPILEAGLREVYFGELLAREVESSSLFTSYVDHFFRERQGQIELWIVFENAGPSLRSYLYTPVIDSGGGFVVFQHSSFWRRLRRSMAGTSLKKHGGERDLDDDNNGALAVISPRSTSSSNDGLVDEESQNHSTREAKKSTPEGRLLFMQVLKQILQSVAFLHSRGIVHRDIKPSNVMCKTSPPMENGIVPNNIESVQCLLGDFSSAWDEFSDRNLYARGPSAAEQTNEYAPPEVLFQSSSSSWAPFFYPIPQSYDSWSIGVVALEMLLGTPNVFSVDQRTTALLTNRLRKEGTSAQDIQRALYLAALSQFCIYVPTETEGKSWPLRRGDPLHEVNVVKQKCTLRDFHNALRARDPLGMGFDESSNTLLHLIWKLLAWDPDQRISASDALLHPYFSIDQNSKRPSDALIHMKNVVDLMIPGSHNALEPQTLDPRIDMNSSDSAVSQFTCPKCGKNFSDHNSCQQHARLRKHALFCTYDRSSLPQCLNAHSMLPTHPTSGYCDIQGRRRTIEDFHTVHLNSNHQFYGIFDGHMGNLASKYAASSFYDQVEEQLSHLDEKVKASPTIWKQAVTKHLIQSFDDLHDGIVQAVASSPGGVMDESGTTATILYLTELAVVIANVGDSRAVMSHWMKDSKGRESLVSFQLTVDHVASLEEERVLIEERGGYVANSGGIDRVNGSLAVSRSLGDVKLAPFLSRVPHVFAMTKEEIYEKICKPTDSFQNQSTDSDHKRLPCYIIIASDGLWDVMGNQEAVDLVLEVTTLNKSGTAFQEAAELLTQEAYVRGSSDNIGVCVVEISQY